MDDRYDATLGELIQYRPLSLRDRFAMAALAHLGHENILRDAETEKECDIQVHNSAAFCYRMADAMMAQREV